METGIYRRQAFEAAWQEVEKTSQYVTRMSVEQQTTMKAFAKAAFDEGFSAGFIYAANEVVEPLEETSKDSETETDSKEDENNV